MKMLHIATAAALILGSSSAAFAQDFVDAPSVIGGGAVGTASSVATGVADGVGGVVGGVGGLVGGVVGAPVQVFTGRSAYYDPAYAPQCSVIGGGAVGTCNSAITP